MKRLIGACLLLALGFSGAAQKNRDQELTEYLRPAVFSLTMVMVHDVVNPPAASRYYAYVMLGAYDLVSQHNRNLIRPNAFIHDYPFGAAAGDSGYDYRIAATYSILETGRLMLPSGYLLEAEEKKFGQMLKKEKWPPALVDRSF